MSATAPARAKEPFGMRRRGGIPLSLCSALNALKSAWLRPLSPFTNRAFLPFQAFIARGAVQNTWALIEPTIKLSNFSVACKVRVNAIPVHSEARFRWVELTCSVVNFPQQHEDKN